MNYPLKLTDKALTLEFQHPKEHNKIKQVLATEEDLKTVRLKMIRGSCGQIHGPCFLYKEIIESWFWEPLAEELVDPRPSDFEPGRAWMNP